jgi:hypothetical protein
LSCHKNEQLAPKQIRVEFAIQAYKKGKDGAWWYECNNSYGNPVYHQMEVTKISQTEVNVIELPKGSFG